MAIGELPTSKLANVQERIFGYKYHENEAILMNIDI